MLMTVMTLAVFMVMAFPLMVVMVTAFVLMLVVVALALMVVMVMAAPVLVLFMMMLPVFVRLLGELFELRLQRVLALDGGEQLLSGELLPIGGDDGGGSVFFEERDRLRDLLRVPRVREHDAARILHLVEEELAEVFEVHLALLGVDDGAEGVELRPPPRPRPVRRG